MEDPRKFVDIHNSDVLNLQFNKIVGGMSK